MEREAGRVRDGYAADVCPDAALGQAPPMWEEFVQAVRSPPSGQFDEHVGEVLKRRDGVLGASTGKAIQVRGASRCVVGPSEQVVLPA